MTKFNLIAIVGAFLATATSFSLALDGVPVAGVIA